VELALVFPLLMLFVLGVTDFGRAMKAYIVITNAAREGARYASHFPWYAIGIRDAVKQEAAEGGVALQDQDIIVVVRDSEPEPLDGASPGDPGVAQSGEKITVGVEYDFTMSIGSMIGLDELTLRAATQMVVFGLDP
jgi:hypothetical protein